MFDIGFAELLLLFIVGLLVLGPERLPKVARTLGGLTRKARSSWLNLKRSIEAEMRAEELKKPLQQFQKDVRSAVDDVNRKVDEYQRAATGKPKPTPPPSTPAPSTPAPATQAPAPTESAASPDTESAPEPDSAASPSTTPRNESG